MHTKPAWAKQPQRNGKRTSTARSVTGRPRMPVPALLMYLSLASAGAMVGCAQTGAGGQPSLLGAPPKLWSDRIARDADVWTILCLEATDPNHRENTEALAKGLRSRPELAASAVRVEHDEYTSRIYYGSYSRKADPDTGRMVLDPMCARTLRFIRSLSVGDVLPFSLARPIPVASDRHDPAEWDLSNAPGAYSLQICYCVTKPGFPDRKDGAVAIVRQLRSEGIEAYYYHGPSKSLVCVGSFDESAVQDDPRYGRRYSREVTALQNRREDFKYNTEWLQKVYKSRGGGPRTAQESFLVPIPRDERWDMP